MFKLLFKLLFNLIKLAVVVVAAAFIIKNFDYICGFIIGGFLICLVAAYAFLFCR